MALVLAGSSFVVACGLEDPAVDRVRTSRAAPSVAVAEETGREPLGRFVRWRAMRHVRKIVGLGPRVRTSEAERSAARYFAEQMRALGYEVDRQIFRVDGRRSRNVVARWPVSERWRVVVGAHMDTVPGSPGANDNASGMAVVLEVARLFAGRPQARLVTFVAFGAEEYGSDGSHHRGSRAFVARLSARGRRSLPGMVSVDMVADGRPLLVATAGIGPKVLARATYRKVTAAGVVARRLTMCDCSDNGPFERAGIPAVLLWSGPDAEYHSASDRIGSMSRADLVRTGRAVRALVRAFDRGFVGWLQTY